jgi:transposase
LSDALDEVRAENAKLRKERDAALDLVTKLTERVAQLERALGTERGGGHNRPPPKRPSSGKPRGGQPDRKGKAPSKPEQVDESRDHHVDQCPRCAGPLEQREGVRERFEFEAVERALKTIRHLMHQAWCPRCERNVQPPTPFTLPDSMYGPHAHATLASLRATMGSTIGDIETFARSLWQRPLSGGQIVAMLDRDAEALVATFWWIVEEATHEPSLNQDTTGWRFDGARAVVWVFTSRRLTVYWIDSEGTQLVPRRVLGEKVDGFVGSDGAERFQLVENAGEQRCVAHSLREARELLAAHPDREELVRMMSELRDRLSRIIGFYKKRAQLAPSTWLQYLSRERAALRRLGARAWEDADCVRMAKRIRRDLDAWLMFMTVPPEQELEPTNNRAERGLRPVVIDRKRMQQNRSLGGVYRDVVLRSVATTCKSLDVSFEAVVVEALLARARAGPDRAPPSPILIQALRDARARAGVRTSAPIAPDCHAVVPAVAGV